MADTDQPNLIGKAPPPLDTAAGVARRLNVSRQLISKYAKEVTPDAVRGKRRLYDVDRFRRWIAANVSQTVGGERDGAGRKPDEPGVDTVDPADGIVDAAAAARGDVGAMALAGLDVSSAETILKQLGKLDPRTASTLLSTIKAARERHDLDVARGLFVNADEARGEWTRHIEQCKNRLEDAARVAADEVAAAFNLDVPSCERVRGMILAKILEAQSVLAG